MKDCSFASAAIRRLDLSGGPGSWFDQWHVHLPEGTVDDPYRATFREDVAELLKAYDELRDAMGTLSAPYQLFVLIDPLRYRENAVYLHTANPNGTPFPLLIEEDHQVELDVELCTPLIEREMNVLATVTDDGPLYYAFDRSIGRPLHVEN